MNLPLNTFWSGIFLTLAGASVLVRHLLLEPGLVNFPKAPKWLLNVYFLFATVMIYLGIRYLWAWKMGDTTTIPPAASPAMVLQSAALSIYNGAMLVNVVNQRMPKRAWRRINNITERAQRAFRRPINPAASSLGKD